MRKTHAVVQVALALMADPGGRHWGYDLSRRCGVASGVVYPILDRMFTAGWLALADDRTDPTAGREYRPPRRYYEITAGGRAALTGLLAEAGRDPRFSALISAWRKNVARPEAQNLVPQLHDLGATHVSWYDHDTYQTMSVEVPGREVADKVLATEWLDMISIYENADGSMDISGEVNRS